MGPWCSRSPRRCKSSLGPWTAALAPSWPQQMQAALPGSDLVILPGQKHAMLIEASDQVLPHLRRFLLAKG